MSGITLHPTKGVNPKRVSCTQCGGETNELLLVGNRDYFTICPKCNTRLIGGGKCPQCREAGVNRTMLPSRIPAGICDACQAKNKECEEVVAAGGIHWRCSDCGSAGAIRGTSELAQAVRKQMGIELPAPCGIEFSKEGQCPVCSADAVKQ